MIKRLHIRNYAIIEKVNIDFSDHLTIITGETGAGKSILLGALELIMGNRADTKVLHNHEEKCVIEGVFDLRKYQLQEFFQVNELDYEDETTVRREITPQGKSRAFINDTPVNLSMLQQLSAALIDLHKQFDTLDIHQVSFQLKMVDALAGNKTLLGEYRSHWTLYTRQMQELEKLRQEQAASHREMDYLQFQLTELAEAQISGTEQEELENEQRKLNHSEELKKTFTAAFQLLSESDRALLPKLEQLNTAIQQAVKYHDEYAMYHKRLQDVIYELQDLSREFENVSENLEYDPERIVEIQSRLDLLYRLQKKHGVPSASELVSLQQEIELRLAGFGDLGERITLLEKDIDREAILLNHLSQELHERRISVVDDFEAAIKQRLELLSMPHAQLKVQIEDKGLPGPTGSDEITFLFSPNKGSKFLPIKEVASGGELSRLTLITKSLVASSIPLPTLVFDEIDTGISGDVSLKMGKILQELSERHQVICITHTPQIASRADRHYFVHKATGEDKTITQVRVLSEEERVREIATMLSGSPPSASALENARELLSSGVKHSSS